MPRAGSGRWALGGRSDMLVVLVTLTAILVLAIASFVWIYASPLIPEGPIRSDGAGYYAYLPAVLLDHDVTMRRTVARSFAGDEYALPGVRPTAPRGDLLDQFPVGEAVLTAPFFAVGHLVARADGVRANGYSWPYEATAAAAGLTYMLIGLALLAFTLLRWFSRGTVALTLVAITFGTDLFHYGTFDATFSHAFSFALAALVLRLALAVWERPRPAAALGLAASLGLVTLVRPTNLTILLFCALIGVDGPAALRRRARALVRHSDLVLLGVVVFFLALIPQVVYWHTITGALFVQAYPHDAGRLDPAHPHLLGVLFSVRKGLFFWTPLLLLAVVGLPRLRRLTPPLFVAAVVYLAVFTWVVASWTIWAYGGSFGMRPFVEALPVLALGFAALVETTRSVAGRRLLAVAIAVTTLLAIHGMLAYWLQDVPYDGTTWHTYLESFAHP